MSAGRAALALLLIFACPARAVFAQDPPPQVQEPESKLEKYLRLAKEGSAPVRPQAARRLVKLGQEAADRVFAECGETPRDMAALGKDLVEVLGAFGDPRLRAKLWAALDDADFPWRPAAALSLAETALPAETERLLALAADPIAPVRKAAVDASRVLELRTRRDAVEALLSDPDDRVRREAATLLAEWGHHWALFWLLEDLKRIDTYFERPSGKIARYDSMRRIAERLGDVAGFEAEKPLDDPVNRTALMTLERKVEKLVGDEDLPSLPAVARAGPATPGDLIGLELRSCRRGEFFLRWNEADVLYVGLGNPARIELPKGTSARLASIARENVGALGERRFWGEPGCDQESLHFRTSEAERTTTLLLSKGPDSVDGLRPDPLGELVGALVATIPEVESDDPRLVDLPRRVRAALAVLGGPLD